MILNIDDIIPICKRADHKNQTIRQIIRYDSGYLKDLFRKDERVVFSKSCFADLKRLTKGHRDNWGNPIVENTQNIFELIKTYGPHIFMTLTIQL